MVPPTLSWGPLLEQPKDASIAGILADNNRFLAWRKGRSSRKGNVVYLEKYDADGGLNLYRKLQMNPGESFRRLFTWNNRKMALFEARDHLRLIPIDGETLSPGSELLRIPKNRDQQWQHLELDDSGGRLCLVMLENRGWQRLVKLRLMVLDAAFSICWDELTTLAYTYAEFYPENVMVSDAGDLFLAGYAQVGMERIVEEGKANFQFIILAFTQHGTVQTEFQIGLRRKIVTDFHVSLNREGNLIGVGFYSENRSAAAGGVFLTQIDPYRQTATGGRLHSLTRAGEMGRLRLGRKFEWNELSNNQGEFLNFSIRNFLADSDGGGLLVAEQVVLQQHYVSFRDGGNYKLVNYNYNDLLLVRLSPGGQVVWVRKIPKRQRTTNDKGRYSSIAAVPAAGEKYIIYNDNGRNFSRDSRLRDFNGLQSVIALTHLGENGQTESFPLAINEELGVLFQPSWTTSLGADRKIIYGQRGRFFRFGILSF